MSKPPPLMGEPGDYTAQHIPNDHVPWPRTYTIVGQASPLMGFPPPPVPHNRAQPTTPPRQRPTSCDRLRGTGTGMTMGGTCEQSDHDTR